MVVVNEKGRNCYRDDKDVEELQRKGDIRLIRKFWVKRSVSRATIESIMGKVWRLSGWAKFQKIDQNTFVIQFATHVVKYKVEDGRPWLFGNHYFAIEGFDGFTQLKDMKF